MDTVSIIEKKKLGKILTEEELGFIIDGYVDGSVTDYQMAAFLMAVRLNGLSDVETSLLTKIYVNSGDTVEFEESISNTADKHSTGGVGDKVSLIIAPIVASLGVYMPKMSGKGLGHTGGTVDKLESIKGFNTELSEEEFVRIIKENQMAIIGQTKDIAVADKKIYALRDVTSTVDSIPLIAASIMSKKLASGANNIVIDVKTGKGAFFEEYDKCYELANKMVSIGKAYNKNIAAFLTDMNSPLGYTVGNKLEVIESRKFLNGEYSKDLYEVCVGISKKIVEMTLNISEDEAQMLILDSLESKKALEKFDAFVKAQGGDINDIPDNYDDVDAVKIEYKAEKSGYINKMDALGIAYLARDLGAGRLTKEDEIDSNVGIRLTKKCGDYVENGEVLGIIYMNKKEVNISNGDFNKFFDINENLEFKNTMIYDIIV